MYLKILYEQLNKAIFFPCCLFPLCVLSIQFKKRIPKMHRTWFILKYHKRSSWVRVTQKLNNDSKNYDTFEVFLKGSSFWRSSSTFLIWTYIKFSSFKILWNDIYIKIHFSFLISTVKIIWILIFDDCRMTFLLNLKNSATMKFGALPRYRGMKLPVT